MKTDRRRGKKLVERAEIASVKPALIQNGSAPDQPSRPGFSTKGVSRKGMGAKHHAR
jgi:hypothetical protein